MLPFKPESLDKLRGRYKTALTPVFDCRYTEPRPRPGELRGHVFDCLDGMRLIISRDRVSDTETYLHLSASAVPGCELFTKIESGQLKQRKFVEMVQRRFTEISDDAGHFELVGFTQGKGVPHFRRLEGH